MQLINIDTFNSLNLSKKSLITKRSWLAFGFIFLLFGLIAFLISHFISDDAWWIHGAWCVVGIFLTIPILVKGMHSGFGVLLKDHFVMFTGSFALYFLFGASVLALGSEDSIIKLLNYYPVSAPDALLVDAINAIGFGIAIIAGALSPTRFISSITLRVAGVLSKVKIRSAMIVFMFFGTLASLNVLSSDLGFREVIISGVWRSIENFSLVAIFLGSFYRDKGSRLLLFFAVFLALIQTFGGFLLFNKSKVLLSVGALIAGLSLRYNSRKILYAGIVLIAFLFVNIAGVVGYSRNTFGWATDTAIGERVRLISEGFSNSNIGDDSTDYSAWGRFCYVPSQNAARNFYDEGIGGNEFGMLPWAFIPRFLAPNKPIMTKTGGELHTKISGNLGSSTGQGIFSSGYYNFGWFGVVIVSILCGWILAQTSVISDAILSRNSLILLPFVLMGVYIAFRIDGHFLTDYIGGFMLIVYPLLIISVVLKLRKL